MFFRIQLMSQVFGYLFFPRRWSSFLVNHYPRLDCVAGCHSAHFFLIQIVKLESIGFHLLFTAQSVFRWMSFNCSLLAKHLVHFFHGWFDCLSFLVMTPFKPHKETCHLPQLSVCVYLDLYFSGLCWHTNERASVNDCVYFLLIQAGESGPGYRDRGFQPEWSQRQVRVGRSEPTTRGRGGQSFHLHRVPATQALRQRYSSSRRTQRRSWN